MGIRALKLSRNNFPLLPLPLGPRRIWDAASTAGLLPPGGRTCHFYSGHGPAAADADYVSPRDFIGWAGDVERLFPGFVAQDTSRASDARYENMVQSVAKVAGLTAYYLKRRKHGLWHGLPSQADVAQKLLEAGLRRTSVDEQMRLGTFNIAEAFRRLRVHAKSR